ncbi:MAG: glycosyltransferase family 39 protein [Deltaproteobacteria bacterium]|nr:glycosyltransferase family 39 protein [Deltaproteobacteria bacterium]
MDHPPLVGWLLWLATAVGGKTVLAVRSMPIAMTLATALFTYLLARDVYGPRAGAWAVLLLAATPVFSVGLTAAAPDAPLAAVWTAFAWLLQRALADDRDGTWPRLGRPAVLGLLVGLAFLAKYTGALLAVAAIAMLAGRRGHPWLKRPGTWLGAALALACALPVFAWNAQHGWAGALHRLVWTQAGAGLGLRNASALLGGQLLYVGPFALALLALAAVHAWKERISRPGAFVLVAASLPTLAFTYALALWSDVAEPHWPAVGYLTLFPAAGALADEAQGVARRLARWTLGFGALTFVVLHVVVLTPALPALVPRQSYEPKYDLGNELRGWPEAAGALRRIDNRGRIVVGAHYTVCAQLAFALARPGDPEVRCASKEIDDFDIWHGPFTLPREGALFVTDNRFDDDPARVFPNGRSEGPPVVLEIERGGRWVRRFEIFKVRP